MKLITLTGLCPSPLLSLPSVCPLLRFDCWILSFFFCFSRLSLPFVIGWIYKVIVVLFVCLQLGVVDSPPRVFNSPYSTATSMDYNPMSRMSEFKVCNLVEKNKFYILYRLFCFSSSLFLNSNYKCNVLNAGSAPATLTESVK